VTDYAVSTIKFLSDLVPELSIEQFINLKNVSSSFLNMMFDVVVKTYSCVKNKEGSLLKALLSVYNFYLRTRETDNLLSLSVGFTDMMTSLFDFSFVPEALSLVQKTVVQYFTSLQKYFVRAEGAEDSVSKFWGLLDFKDNRNIVNILFELTSVSSTCLLIHELSSKLRNTKTLTKIVDVVNHDLLSPHSDLRRGLKRASECVARLFDYMALNYEHMIKGEFSKISFKLPAALIFENDYAEFSATFERMEANPLYLQEINKTTADMRDECALLISRANKEIATTTQGAVKGTMVRYLARLNHCMSILLDKLNPDNTKPQPMVVTLVGPAGCGKSTLATNVGKIMQSTAGRNMNADKIKNRGGDPKFEPAITTETEVIIYDDLANDKNVKLETKSILDIVNVSRECIPKASVEEKNKHKYSNIGTVFTTNAEDLGMSQLNSASPESLLRRFGLVVVLKVKDEYCVGTSGVLDRYHPVFADGKPKKHIYEVVLKFPVSYSKGQIDWKIVEGWKIEGQCDLHCALVHIKSYLAGEWERSTSQHEMRNSEECVCSTCGLDYIACTCSDSPVQAEALPSLDKYYGQFMSGLGRAQDSVQAWYHSADESALAITDILHGKWTRAMMAQYSATYVFRMLMWIFMQRNLVGGFTSLYLLLITIDVKFLYLFICLLCSLVGVKYRIEMRSMYVLLMFVMLSAGAFAAPIVCTLFLPFVGVLVCYKLACIRERNRLTEKHFQQHSLIRQHYYARLSVYIGVTSSALFVVLYMLNKIVKVFFGPKTESRRNVANDPYDPKEVKSNVDDRAHYFYKPTVHHDATCMTRKQFESKVSDKTLIVEVTGSHGTVTVRGIPSGSELIAPYHAFPASGTFDIEICADYSKRTSAYKMKNVPRDYLVQLKDRSGNPVDLCMVNLANFPRQACLIKHLATEQQPMQGAGLEIVKQTDGSVKRIELRLSDRIPFTGNSYKTAEHGRFSNYPSYTCISQTEKSEQGMCGSPVLSKNTNCILGVHIAGTGSSTWFALRLTQDMVLEGRKALAQQATTFLAHAKPEAFVVKNNLQELEFENEVTTRAVDDIGVALSPLVQIGTIYKGASLYSDRAENFYFPNTNPKLEEAFGPRQSRPPVKVNGTEQINSTLIKLNDPKFNVPLDLLDRAAKDYLDGFGETDFNSIISELREDDTNFFSVRSVDQALKGDESGIVRGINNASSAGWIYGGKKTTHYDMTVDGDPHYERVLLPYMMKDLETQEAQWRRGEGTYDPFKRCSKANELLPWNKAAEKTRSFYGNDMVFFLNMTRAIIPLKHVLRKNKEHSECFVGISAQSAEWRKLRDFLTKDGKYRNFLCGDFSGYDTQLPKALLDKAAYILVEMARRGGMGESDLEFLRGALSSVVSPVLIWQGHVLEAANGQPSGQPLTVEINSIVNSLLMRMTYFHIMDTHYPHLSQSNFRHFNRLATYGDDNVLGVDDRIPRYNHTEIQSVLASWGIKYTMADKEADSVPYQSLAQISFLKRAFEDHPELGVVGPLERESIVKGFYYWVRPKNTPLNFPEQFEALVASQVREAALHGRKFYEEFCNGVRLLQEGSLEMKDEFRINWNDFDLPLYDELVSDLKWAYETSD